jgi:hypothetical protein
VLLRKVRLETHQALDFEAWALKGAFRAAPHVGKRPCPWVFCQVHTGRHDTGAVRTIDGMIHPNDLKLMRRVGSSQLSRTTAGSTWRPPHEHR